MSRLHKRNQTQLLALLVLLLLNRDFVLLGGKRAWRGRWGTPPTTPNAVKGVL